MHDWKEDRFVGEFGGHGNISSVVIALLSVLQNANINTKNIIPWYFPTAQEYKAKLENYGFNVKYIELIARPTLLKTEITDWLKIFANEFFKEVKPNELSNTINKAAELLKNTLCDTSNRWTVDYVRLRFIAQI